MNIDIDELERLENERWNTEDGYDDWKERHDTFKSSLLAAAPALIEAWREREAYQQAIEAVRDLHARFEDSFGTYCNECKDDYPCSTITALTQHSVDHDAANSTQPAEPASKDGDCPRCGHPVRITNWDDDVRAMAKMTGTEYIKWILECGCEPQIEHCDQCDERRKLRARLENPEFMPICGTEKGAS